MNIFLNFIGENITTLGKTKPAIFLWTIDWVYIVEFDYSRCQRNFIPSLTTRMSQRIQKMMDLPKFQRSNLMLWILITVYSYERASLFFKAGMLQWVLILHAPLGLYLISFADIPVQPLPVIMNCILPDVEKQWYNGLHMYIPPSAGFQSVGGSTVSGI